jgi:hypothetical protein
MGEERASTARAGAAQTGEAEWRRSAQGRRRADARCPRCWGTTRLLPNPYYGVGLCVSREIRLCTRCEWASGATGPVLPATAPEEEMGSRKPQHRGPLCRTRAALGRLFALGHVRTR